MDPNNTSIVPYYDHFDDDDDVFSQFNISFLDENPTINETTNNLNSDFVFSDYDPLFVGNSTNPEGEVPGSSNNCQILREITHGNGTFLSKLGIFGTIGRISHASLEKSTMENHVSTSTIDFSNESISNVKQFLVQYFEGCKQDGYILLEDPLSEFYQALSVNSGDSTNDINNLLQLSPTTSRDFQMEQQEMANGSEVTSTDMAREKIPLSEQRKRIKRMKAKDLASHVHRPLQEAAKELKLCITVIKKICRRNGVNRWPSRTIKSIQTKIAKLQNSLNSISAEERKRVKADITKLKKELEDILKPYKDMSTDLP